MNIIKNSEETYEDDDDDESERMGSGGCGEAEIQQMYDGN